MFFHDVLILPKRNHVLVFVLFAFLEDQTTLAGEGGLQFAKLGLHDDILECAHDVVEQQIVRRRVMAWVRGGLLWAKISV